MQKKEIIIARQSEISILEKIFKSNKAEFLAIFGRRRVGKTYLIRTFYKKKTCLFFNAVGIKKAPIQRQLAEFTKEMSRIFYNNAILKEADNWFDAFEELLKAINNQTFKNQKIILFFDEFPWMYTHRSKLLDALDFYWNRHFSTDSRIKLVICGSSASWIIKNIINNKGGLHNRLTQTIQLEPFNLYNTKAFLKYNGIKLNNQHIAEIYMATGGIPYYLLHIGSGLSSTQIIHELAFAKNSFFLTEFNNLYASLFDDSDTYIALMRTIATKKSGINQEELFNAMGEQFSKGGTLVNKLKDLENAGFIISFIPYKHQKKGIFYRAIDEYTLFYFHWVEPIRSTIQLKGLRSGYWQKIQQSPRWHNWAGYAFESICYKHLTQISETLKLSPASLPGGWRYTPKKNSTEEGTQIDLLFERDDNAITLCEIKYSTKPFSIDKAYAANLNNKVAIFKKVTHTNSHCFLAIISANGLKDTMYSTEMIDAIVTLNDLFNDDD